MKEKLTFMEIDRLPKYLQNSIYQFENGLKKIQQNEKYNELDMDICELQADISSAEIDHLITSEMAWEIREIYLKMKRC